MLGGRRPAGPRGKPGGRRPRRVPCGAGLGAYYALSEDYRRARLMSFRNPFAYLSNEGYQLSQSLLAFGSGGLFGMGLGKGRQKYAFMPYPESDFIFAVVGEDLGLVGCIAVLALFAAFVFFALRTAIRCRDRFGSLLAGGIGAMIGIQVIMNVAVVIGIAMSIGLFFLLPTLLGTAVVLFTDSMVVRNVAESLLKMAIFVGYLALCSRMKDMRRVFSYHGAEHKSIFCYEAGLPLTVENVRIQPRHHPRCGTSFLFVVIFISILVSSVVFGIWPVTNPLLRFGAHLLMLPIIVGVSYEFNRWAGRSDCRLSRILRAPGLWMQNFTTFEPDDSMIEVGIKALELVLPENKGEDEW